MLCSLVGIGVQGFPRLGLEVENSMESFRVRLVKNRGCRSRGSVYFKIR